MYGKYQIWQDDPDSKVSSCHSSHSQTNICPQDANILLSADSYKIYSKVFAVQENFSPYFLLEYFIPWKIKLDDKTG